MKGWLAALAAACALAGCERTMKDMYEQPKLGPDAPSPLWADGKGSRPPPPGSVPVAMGDLAGTSSGRRGRDELVARDAALAASAAPAADLALLHRGQARFEIHCAPCHSIVGDGDGMVARRGFPHPPSFHQARLRDAPDRHLFDVITQGYGVMPPYADRVTPQDRWAIVAYIRALQLARRGTAASSPASAAAPAIGASNPETS
jgi:mono/diheme cytochrome c family protein